MCVSCVPGVLHVLSYQRLGVADVGQVGGEFQVVDKHLRGLESALHPETEHGTVRVLAEVPGSMCC